ncbi:probable aspartyl aminopeptidase [Tanacetum coccineum]
MGVYEIGEQVLESILQYKVFMIKTDGTKGYSLVLHLGRKLGRIVVHNAICDDDYDEHNKVVADNGSDGGKPNESPNAITNQKHHSLLLQMLATQVGSKPDDICDFELQACDTKPTIISGQARRESSTQVAQWACD